jgi:hypothetical protein
MMHKTGALCFARVRSLLPAIVVLGAAGWSQTGVAAQRSTNPVAEFAAIAVESVTVDRNPATEGLPEGLGLVLHDRIIRQLWKTRLFPDVLDASDSVGDGPRVNLSCTVLSFGPGSRATRLTFGIWAGRTKIRARFLLRDAQSGAEVLQFERQGTFKGTMGLSLGSIFDGPDQANLHAVDGLANAAIKELASDLRRIQPAVAQKPELPMLSAADSEPPGEPALPSKPITRQCAEDGRSDGRHVGAPGAFTIGFASGLGLGPAGAIAAYFAQGEPKLPSSRRSMEDAPGCRRAYEAGFAEAGRRHKQEWTLVGGALGSAIFISAIVYAIGESQSAW